MKAVDWFEDKAEEDKVILIFDDIQLADQLTLDFLKYLTHRINRKYLSVWFTYETGIQGSEALDDFLRILGEEKFGQYDLQPLDEEGCHTIVKSMFSANCFPEGFVTKLFKESVGNPFHLKMLLNSLVDRELIQLHGEVWDFTGQLQDIEHSYNLDQLFLDRIQSVQGRAREVAKILGVSAGSLRLSVLCDILERPESEVSEDLIPLMHNGWVSQYQRDGHLWVGFNHPGFCEAAIADLTTEQRQDWHLRIAEYCQNHQNVDDPKIQEALGYHWLKIGDVKQVAKYALQAGRARLARLDPYAARDYWHEALELLEPCAEYRDTVQHILFSLADLYRDIGEQRKAIEIYKELKRNLCKEDIEQHVTCLNQIAMAQDRLGDTEDARRNWLACLELMEKTSHTDIGGIYGGLGWLSFREGDHEEAVRYCREGLALMDRDQTTKQKAYLLNTLGTLCFYRGEIEAALKLWRDALKIRKKLGLQKGISDLHNNIGAALNAMGNPRGAKWHWNRCLEISKQLGDVERMGGIYNNLGIQAYEQGKLQEANRYYRQALDIFNRLGARRDIASTLNNLGEVAMQRAEYITAMEYWQQALEIGEELADKESQIEPLYQLGQLHILLGEYAEAEARLATSEAIANNINASGPLGNIYELLARLTLQSGDIDTAKDYSERALDHLKRSGDQVKLARGWVTRGEVAAAQGDGKLMAECMDQGKQLAKETGELHLIATSLLCTLNHALEKGKEKTDSKAMALALKEALEHVTPFPELTWQAHWVRGKFLKCKGRWKAATDAYSQSVSILKQISRKLSEPHQSSYLHGKAQQKFREEVITLKNLIER
ncbi:hypothetical protein AMJ86_05280 [bacterium SM23_57]|nr:MAG: hypothetical protein AMJ86_05280 [bacterium SM23_57]